MQPRGIFLHSPPTAGLARAAATPATRISRASLTGQRGFTLIEIVAVLVIFAVITALATERFFGQRAGETTAIAAEIRSQLRYARTRSMSSDDIWGVRILSATTYAVFRTRTGVTTNIVLPGEGNAVITVAEGATLSPTTAIIAFDTWGRPCSDLAGATLRPADLTVTVTHIGSTENIIITRNTGFMR